MRQIPAGFFKRPFIHYFKEHPRAFALGVVSLFFTNLFDILTPLALKAGIDGLENQDGHALTTAVLAYAGFMAGYVVCRYLWRIFFGQFQHSVAEDLRNRIFEKLCTLGPTFYHKTPVGQLMSLIINDVNTFRMAIGPGVLILLDAVFYIAMIVPVMIWLSWSWTWKTLIILPFVPFFMRKMETLIHERYREAQDRLSEMSGKAQEIIAGIRPIKSFAQEDNQTSFFNVLSRAYEKVSNRFAIVDSAFDPVMQLSVTLGSVILLWLCTPEVMRAEVTLGTFVAFHEYIKRMVWPMTAIGSGASMCEQGLASFDRITELLTTETDIPDTGDTDLEHFESLEVRDLTFHYEGAANPALHKVSFTLRAGETIGIVGPVGAGKTTLLSLLCRLYPAPPNSILINGVPIERLTRKSLAKLISSVPQEAFLFSDTISENVALGLECFPGLEPIRDATSVVNIDKEIDSMPQGYASYLGERGVNLSGGQKQRLTIARALIRRSPVLFLDDSLSAVDAKTERAIVGALKEGRARHPDQAVIIVSHRLATLMHADRIIVIVNGEIEAVGTHDELMRTSPTYEAMNRIQSSTIESETGDAAAPLVGGNQA